MSFRFRSAARVALAALSLVAADGLARHAWSQGTPAQTPQPPPTPRPTDPVPPVQPAGQPPNSVRPRMREHFARGAEIRDAVIRADLEGIRVPAKWLAELPQEDLPASGQPYIGQMQRLATEIGGATDIAQAANGVARLAAACGECHLAMDVTPTLMAKRAKGEDETLAGRMRKHYRAADLLYRGLIVPNEHSWEVGAGVLTEDPVQIALKPGGTPTPEIEALSKRLRDLAQEASKATDQKARSDVYGRMLATCSACHKEQGISVLQGTPKA